MTSCVHLPPEASLASLEEFKRQREQLKSNMESLEKQLISQEEKHKVELHNLEMTVLLEKKRSVNQTLRVKCPTIVTELQQGVTCL